MPPAKKEICFRAATCKKRRNIVCTAARYETAEATA
jgi:hypothetical protein